MVVTPTQRVGRSEGVLMHLAPCLVIVMVVYLALLLALLAMPWHCTLSLLGGRLTVSG